MALETIGGSGGSSGMILQIVPRLVPKVRMNSAPNTDAFDPLHRADASVTLFPGFSPLRKRSVSGAAHGDSGEADESTERDAGWRGRGRGGGETYPACAGR